MIEFDRVTFAFPGKPDQPVIDGFSLRIDKGEEIAVIGGNGSGKTTFGLLLSGILKPQSGKISIDGRVVAAGDDNLVIGFLFQDPDNGLVATTVDREVAFSLENRNLPPTQIRPMVEQALDRFHLSKFRKRLVWQLSGGEKQRLSLAALLVTEPKILFLDEPASYLDYRGKKILEEALASIRQREPSLTIIRVTQFPDLALKFKRVILIDKGRVTGDSSPEEIFSQTHLISGAGLGLPVAFLKPRPKPVTPPLASDKDEKALAKIASLCFKYDLNNTSYLIDNISLEINSGRVLALVGPSGCGKSTLAQLICGIYQPQAGAITFSSEKTRAVMSFQQPEKQFFLDTVFDEVAYGLKGKIDSPAELERSVRGSLEKVGLDYDSFRDRDPFSLSGGEARRLAFAVTVALDGDIIIFDEPTCGLDEMSIRIFMGLVRELRGAGKAVIIITHDSDLIGDVADRIALIEDGQVKRIAAPIEFYSDSWDDEVLSIPDVMRYQMDNYGSVITSRREDIFEL